MRRLLLAFALVFAAAGPATAAAKLANQTQMTFAPGHGTQIEYLAADGASYLWYPGNAKVVAGAWKTEGADICFRYGANTYNPVTRSAGGSWDCEKLQRYASGVTEHRLGDVFGLAGRKSVPFSLPAQQLPMDQLLAIAFPQPEVRVDPQEKCKTIIAQASAGHDAMVDAAILYYHGMWMGEKCVKVDYVRAFELLRETGDTRTYASLLRDLRDKAAAGLPKAVAALKQIER